MKYWGFFAAKLGAAAVLLGLIWLGIDRFMPEPADFMKHRLSRFPQDLPWTMAILGFWLLSLGVLYLIIWDQRRRCRACLRRLRMPIEKGSWSHAFLLSPPRTESICPYGHGTLKTPEVNVSSSEPEQWRSHEDIWRELDNLEETRR